MEKISEISFPSSSHVFLSLEMIGNLSHEGLPKVAERMSEPQSSITEVFLSFSLFVAASLVMLVQQCSCQGRKQCAESLFAGRIG